MHIWKNGLRVDMGIVRFITKRLSKLQVHFNKIRDAHSSIYVMYGDVKHTDLYLIQ